MIVRYAGIVAKAPGKYNGPMHIHRTDNEFSQASEEMLRALVEWKDYMDADKDEDDDVVGEDEDEDKEEQQDKEGEEDEDKMRMKSVEMTESMQCNCLTR